MATASVSHNLIPFLRRARRQANYCFVAAVLASGAVSETAWALGNPMDLRAVEPTPQDIEQAAKYFDDGRAAFRQENYVEAAEAFEKADALAPNAKVLLLAIQSRELGGHLARAATLAALAEQRHPKDPMFDDLGDLLKAAREGLHLLVVTCESPCQITVGNRLVHGAAATRRFLYLEEGKYRIRASWGTGQALSKYHEATAGTRGKLRFEANSGEDANGSTGPRGEDEWDTAQSSGTSSTPSEGGSAAAQSDDNSADSDDWGDDGTWEDPPDDPMASRSESDPVEDQKAASNTGGADPVVFWSGVAVTGVLAGVSTWSGFDTLQNPGTDVVTARCVGLGESCPEYQEGLRNQRRTNILWGVTGGVGVITVLIGALWTDWDGDSTPKPNDEAHLSFNMVPVFTERPSAEADHHASRVRLDGSLFTASGRF